MTNICGIKLENSIVLGSDSKIQLLTEGKTIGDKIYFINTNINKIIVANSGFDVFDKWFQIFRKQHSDAIERIEKLTVRGLGKLLRLTLNECYKTCSYNVYIIGFDCKSKLVAYEIKRTSESDNSCNEIFINNKFICSGYGTINNSIVEQILSSKIPLPDDEEKSIQLIRRIIDKAISSNSKKHLDGVEKLEKITVKGLHQS